MLHQRDGAAWCTSALWRGKEGRKDVCSHESDWGNASGKRKRRDASVSPPSSMTTRPRTTATRVNLAVQLAERAKPVREGRSLIKANRQSDTARRRRPTFRWKMTMGPNPSSRSRMDSDRARIFAATEQALWNKEGRRESREEILLSSSTLLSAA